MEPGLLLVVATHVFSLLGRILMLGGSATAESGGLYRQAAGVWTHALVFAISGTWSKTPLLSALQFPPLWKDNSSTNHVRWLWGLNEMWPRKRQAQHVAHGKHLIILVGSLSKYNLPSIPHRRGVACLGLTLSMRFGLHATNRQLTCRAVRTTFTWGTFVNWHPVHHVLPVVSENMQRLCQNLVLDCSLRPPLVSV